MAKKKKEAAPEATAEQAPQKVQKEEAQKKEKRPPQMVTVNGDKVSHAHAFKSNKSEDWFFTAKINGVPLKSVKMDSADLEKFMSKEVSVEDMMKKYYPSVLQQKVSPAEFKLPKTINTAEGEQDIYKFNVYKEVNPESQDFGKYRFYAQVNDKKMSCTGSKEDLNAYFNRTMSPVNLVIKNFGDRLGIAAHYEQFKLPEGMKLGDDNVRIDKNPKTNHFEIKIKDDSRGLNISKELKYEDRISAFIHKVATKEQLAAKYFGDELKNAPMNVSNRETQKVAAKMGR